MITMTGADGRIYSQAPLVRCGECVHYTLRPGKWECDLYDWVHEPDWFCADGESTEGDVNDQVFTEGEDQGT